MSTFVRCFVLVLATAMLSVPALAADVSKQEMKSLDEQVQDVKADALKTGANLLLLEQRLLYPSSTQVAVYVSEDSAATYRLDSLEVKLDGKPAARHLYTLRELDALHKGGMQRIYAGNIATGDHIVEVTIAGKTLGGPGFTSTERFKFSKDVGAKILEVHLIDATDHMITLRDW